MKKKIIGTGTHHPIVSVSLLLHSLAIPSCHTCRTEKKEFRVVRTERSTRTPLHERHFKINIKGKER